MRAFLFFSETIWFFYASITSETIFSGSSFYGGETSLYWDFILGFSRNLGYLVKKMNRSYHTVVVRGLSTLCTVHILPLLTIREIVDLETLHYITIIFCYLLERIS